MSELILAVSISEAVQISGLSRSYLYRAIRAGKLPVRKAGTRTLILRRELETFLSNLSPIQVEQGAK